MEIINAYDSAKKPAFIEITVMPVECYFSFGDIGIEKWLSLTSITRERKFHYLKRQARRRSAARFNGRSDERIRFNYRFLLGF